MMFPIRIGASVGDISLPRSSHGHETRDGRSSEENNNSETKIDVLLFMAAVFYPFDDREGPVPMLYQESRPACRIKLRTSRAQPKGNSVGFYPQDLQRDQMIHFDPLKWPC